MSIFSIVTLIVNVAVVAGALLWATRPGADAVANSMRGFAFWLVIIALAILDVGAIFIRAVIKHLAVVIAVLAIVGGSASAQCGVERTPVKDLKDPATREIHFDIKTNTVALLRKVKPPAKIGNTLERQDGEKQVYEVQAELIGYKYEADGDRDYHVVISTPGNPAETMIIEIPHPDCAPVQYKQVFAAERAFVDSLAVAVAPKHKPGPAFYQFPKPIPVIAAGVAFFDKVHGTHKNLDGTIGQVGVAPNGIEFHPALKISRAQQ